MLKDKGNKFSQLLFAYFRANFHAICALNEAFKL